MCGIVKSCKGEERWEKPSAQIKTMWPATWHNAMRCVSTWYQTKRLDVANLGNKVVELLLCGSVLGRHFLVLGLPLVSGRLESLHLALVVASLDVGRA